MDIAYDEQYVEDARNAEQWLSDRMKEIDDMQLTAMKIYREKLELAASELKYRNQERLVLNNG